VLAVLDQKTGNNRAGRAAAKDQGIDVGRIVDGHLPSGFERGTRKNRRSTATAGCRIL
jgi:hypothetical protein